MKKKVSHKNVESLPKGKRDSKNAEVNAFINAVLNKDGPNAHPDSMFAMKYSDKF